MDDKKKKILLYTPLLLVLGLFFMVYIHTFDVFVFIKHFVLLIFSHAVAVTDLREKRIPNKWVLAMIVTWLIITIPQIFWNINNISIILFQSGIGFLAGGGMFLFLYIISRKGVGGGDVKFMAAAGLYLTLYRLMSTIVYGSILAGLTALILLITKRVKKNDAIPLVPFLYIGIIISMFFVG